MRRLRVGIDGRAFRSPAAGIRRYLAGLVPALQRLEDAPDLVALGGDAEALPEGLEHAPAYPHPPTNAGWTIVGLPATARRASVDLIHAPAYTAPFWAGVPVVLTIHDVSYERHPEWYPYRRDILRRAFYRRSARAASHILTVSQFSAGEIVAAYGIPRERISVVPLGVSNVFGPLASEPAATLPSAIHTPFVLHVGDLHERRNLRMLVDAFLEARRRVPALPQLSLVIAGIDRGVVEELHSMAANAGAPDSLVHLGSVPEDLLHRLYRAADALVYPSRYEGFGLPVLEAMASGAPVVASRAASIPEITGTAAWLLDPDDRQAWTDAIVGIVTDRDRRGRMRAAGLERASAFTWERTAAATVAAYARVAS